MSLVLKIRNTASEASHGPNFACNCVKEIMISTAGAARWSSIIVYFLYFTKKVAAHSLEKYDITGTEEELIVHRSEQVPLNIQGW